MTCQPLLPNTRTRSPPHLRCLSGRALAVWPARQAVQCSQTDERHTTAALRGQCGARVRVDAAPSHSRQDEAMSNLTAGGRISRGSNTGPHAWPLDPLGLTLQCALALSDALTHRHVRLQGGRALCDGGDEAQMRGRAHLVVVSVAARVSMYSAGVLVPGLCYYVHFTATSSRLPSPQASHRGLERCNSLPTSRSADDLMVRLAVDSSHVMACGWQTYRTGDGIGWIGAPTRGSAECGED